MGMEKPKSTSAISPLPTQAPLSLNGTAPNSRRFIRRQTWLIRVVDLPGKGKVLLGPWEHLQVYNRPSDEAGLASQWTSQKLSGTVVGYQVADVDNDGLNELVVANVTSESYFLGFPKSRLVVYDLE